MSDNGPDPRDIASPDEPTTPASGAEHALEETLVARVRADDPASGVVPDAPALRAAVEQRLAAGTVDQLAARRRRRMWIPVAAAAAGALVLGGGGGYAIGASGGDAKTAVVADAGAQEGSGAGASVATGPVAPQPAGRQGAGMQAAAGESGAADTTMRGGYGGWGGRTVFTAKGLSDQGGSATAYALDVATAYTAERLAAVAAALGVTAPVTQVDGGGLQAGPTDGSGPAVSLYPGGDASISYYDPTKDQWSCPSDGKECTQRDLGTPPSYDEAKAQLAAILAAAGFDAAEFSFEPQTYVDQTWTSVTATRMVDGQRSDLMWNGSWTGAGLQSLYGSIAPVVSLGSYEVISPVQAVARLGDPRFGSSFGPVLYADEAMGGAAATSSAAAAPDQPAIPTTPAPGSKLSWSVTQVTIVSATLTLGSQWQPDGGIVLAPVYQLTGSDGSVWSVIAVADGSLDFS